MSEQYTNKIALVTGGNSGIGKATALLFARKGAKVVIAARRADEGQRVAREIEEQGGEALFVPADISKESEVKDLIDISVERFGRIDCAFNNAGISVRGALHEISEEDWDRVINVNLKGLWLCMKHQIAQLIKQGGGVICNNSSLAGLAGWYLSPIYAASKHGVIGLTKSAALQYANQNIRINALCPGSVHTELMDKAMQENSKMEEFFLEIEPIERLCQPEEIAEAALWLCSEQASFVTGAVLPVDGGALAGLWPKNM